MANASFFNSFAVFDSDCSTISISLRLRVGGSDIYALFLSSFPAPGKGKYPMWFLENYLCSGACSDAVVGKISEMGATFEARNI